METNFCIVENYFNTLKLQGYVKDEISCSILKYFAIKELTTKWDWSSKVKQYFRKLLDSMESNLCFISECIPCTNSKNRIECNNCGDFGYMSDCANTNYNIVVGCCGGGSEQDSVRMRFKITSDMTSFTFADTRIDYSELSWNVTATADNEDGTVTIVEISSEVRNDLDLGNVFEFNWNTPFNGYIILSMWRS